jgi:7,8-dihydropterin-6-yl-methyl-4-(beta-D-ribofuranosyl)aminobenzene 5'-phosphate synthase
MQIKVLFDKYAISDKLRVGWGVSFLIEDNILFDTGEKGEWLLENIRSLGVDINKIEAIVVSHDHWDHWGGLWDILKQRRGVKVYACPGFGKEFKEKVKESKGELIEAKKFTEISPNIYISGEIAGAYHGKYMAEQAVVLKTGNGITIITGCAHPGILKMVEKVKAKFSAQPLYLVLGGFHFMESDKRSIEIVVESFKKMSIIKAGPTHCSGELAEKIFQDSYKNGFVPIKVGQILEI